MNQESLAYWHLNELDQSELRFISGGRNDNHDAKNLLIALGAFTLAALYLAAKQLGWFDMLNAHQQYHGASLLLLETTRFADYNTCQIDAQSSSYQPLQEIDTKQSSLAPTMLPPQEKHQQKAQADLMRLGFSGNKLPPLRQKVIGKRFEKTLESPYFNVKVSHQEKRVYMPKKPFFIKRSWQECLTAERESPKNYPRLGDDFISTKPLITEQEHAQEKKKPYIISEFHRTDYILRYIRKKITKAWKDYTFVIDQEINGERKKEKIPIAINGVVPSGAIKQELNNWVISELSGLASFIKAHREASDHSVENEETCEYMDQQMAARIYLLGKSFGITFPLKKLKELGIKWLNKQLALAMGPLELATKAYQKSQSKIERIKRYETNQKSILKIPLLIKQGRNTIAASYETQNVKKKRRLGSINELVKLQKEYGKIRWKAILEHPYFTAYANHRKKTIKISEKVSITKTNEEWKKFFEIVKEDSINNEYRNCGFMLSTLLPRDPIITLTSLKNRMAYHLYHSEELIRLSNALHVEIQEKKLHEYTFVTQTSKGEITYRFPMQVEFDRWLTRCITLDIKTALEMQKEIEGKKIVLSKRNLSKAFEEISSGYLFFSNLLGLKPTKGKFHLFYPRRKDYKLISYRDLPKSLTDLGSEVYEKKQKQMRKIKRNDILPPGVIPEVINYRLLAKLKRNG